MECCKACQADCTLQTGQEWLCGAAMFCCPPPSRLGSLAAPAACMRQPSRSYWLMLLPQRRHELQLSNTTPRQGPDSSMTLFLLLPPPPACVLSAFRLPNRCRVPLACALAADTRVSHCSAARSAIDMLLAQSAGHLHPAGSTLSHASTSTASSGPCLQAPASHLLAPLPLSLPFCPARHSSLPAHPSPLLP